MQSTFSLVECSRIPACTGPPFQWEAAHKWLVNNEQHRRAQTVRRRRPTRGWAGGPPWLRCRTEGVRKWAFLSVTNSAQNCSAELRVSLGTP